MKRHRSSVSEARSSSISSSESDDIYRLATRLARMYFACIRMISSPLTTSAQPNAEADKRSSLANGVAGDAPRGNTDISQQGSEQPHKPSQAVPEGAESPSKSVNKPRDTKIEKFFILCRYCGQSSRVEDFIDRERMLRRCTKTGIPPSRTLTPVRCRTCYCEMPVSPLVRPKTASAAHHEKELVASGKMKLLNPTIKPRALDMTLKVMMDEWRLQKEDENKKRELSEIFVTREVVLRKLHMRRAVLGAWVPG